MVTTIPLPAAGLRASNGERSWPSLVLCFTWGCRPGGSREWPRSDQRKVPREQQEPSKMVSWDLEVACRATRTSTINSPRRNMGRSMTRVTPGLLANLVTSAALHDEKLDQHFEVFARDGKLLQSQYAKAAGGSRDIPRDA